MTELPLSGQRVALPDGAVAWWPCHIGKRSSVGMNTSIGALAHIGQDVKIGKDCKIQGAAYIADRSVLEDCVFVGPNATLLNDRYPPSGDAEKWSPTHVGKGAVVGGNSTVVAGCNIGTESVLGAGSVLTKHLPPREVWAGNPARFLMTRSEYENKRTVN